MPFPNNGIGATLKTVDDVLYEIFSTHIVEHTTDFLRGKTPRQFYQKTKLPNFDDVGGIFLRPVANITTNLTNGFKDILSLEFKLEMPNLKQIVKGRIQDK